MKARKRYTEKDFAWVAWTPKNIERVGKGILQKKKERYAKIRAIPEDKRTFENTLYSLEASDNDLSDDGSRISLLKEVSPNPVIRAAAGKVLEKISKEEVEIEFDPRMYAVMKEYALRKEKLSGPKKLLFEDTMKGYARMGFDLPKAKQNRLKKNINELTKFGLAFDKNLNNYKDHILVTETELDGLPETYKQSLTRVGEKYKITLSYPDALPYISGAHDEARRKELYEKFERKGGKENITILSSMIKLRAENAKLLGYKNHVDYKTELRMAKSAKNVDQFLRDLERRTKKKAREDLVMLTAYKRTRTGDKKAVVHAHDASYLFKHLRKERFDLDTDLLKEYFPFQHVKDATLEAYQKLFGIRFVQRRDIPLWYTDVEFYDIYDKKHGYLASFALDLYPRDGKYGHAGVTDVVAGRKEGAIYRPPLAVMMTNFPKPTKANPSLMSHREVETFFHEFGHVMHCTLTTAEFRSQAGSNTAWDFVEAPSQMLENWVWDKHMLKRLSRHYKTGTPLPDDMISRLIASRHFGEATNTRRQVVLARLDYLLHTKKYKNINALYAKLEKEYLGIAPPKTQLWIASFGHLAHGYDAGYYGYLWSLVYAQDMFTRFEKMGILNPRVGKEYRKWILEKGSSQEEMELVKGFLGRKPNNKAFLRSIGA